MSPAERAYAFVEAHAVGVDTMTFGFDANEFKTWMAESITEVIAEDRARIRSEIQTLLDGDFCGSDVEALRAAQACIDPG